MKQQIIHKKGSILFETEAKLLKEAVEKAVVSGVKLKGALLACADLAYADLQGAYLSSASLQYANFAGAKLQGADLVDADLQGSNLLWADLQNSNLRGANLRFANLQGAGLANASWNETKSDMVEKMSLMPDEVPLLYQALIDGKINGCSYEEDCACFVGTLAKAKHIKINSIPIKANPDSPIEKFFLGIQKGDTPENNPLSALAVEWIEEFCKEKSIKLPTRRVIWE